MYVYLCCEKKDFSAGDKNSSERDTMLNGTRKKRVSM